MIPLLVCATIGTVVHGASTFVDKPVASKPIVDEPVADKSVDDTPVAVVIVDFNVKYLTKLL